MPTPAKPTALLELEGTYREDRHGGRADQMVASDAAPEPPEWLNDEAREEWWRVVNGYAVSGIITPLDRGMLATYCSMWSRFAAAEQAVPYVGQNASFINAMILVASKLGLTPVSRASMKVPNAKPKQESADPWSEFAIAPSEKRGFKAPTEKI